MIGPIQHHGIHNILVTGYMHTRRGRAARAAMYVAVRISRFIILTGNSSDRV